MSKLKRYDIFNKAPDVLRKISIQRSGRWVFTNLQEPNYARKTETQRFYLINEPFGLCKFNQVNPEKTFVRGKNGDYIVADPNDNLTLVTAAEYALKFPKEKPRPMGMPLTSSQFSSKDYTKTLVELQSEDSNTNRTNLPSTGGSANARSGNTRPTY